MRILTRQWAAQGKSLQVLRELCHFAAHATFVIWTPGSTHSPLCSPRLFQTTHSPPPLRIPRSKGSPPHWAPRGSPVSHDSELEWNTQLNRVWFALFFVALKKSCSARDESGSSTLLWISRGDEPLTWYLAWDNHIRLASLSGEKEWVCGWGIRKTLMLADF